MKRLLPAFLCLSALMWTVSLVIGWKGCWGVIRECDVSTVESFWDALLLSAPLWVAGLTINRCSRVAATVRIFCLLALAIIFYFGWQIIINAVLFFPLKNPDEGLGIFIGNIFFFRF